MFIIFVGGDSFITLFGGLRVWVLGWFGLVVVELFRVVVVWLGYFISWLAVLYYVLLWV